MKPCHWRLLTAGIIILIAVNGLQKSNAQTTVNITAAQAQELVADAGEDATIDVGESITIGGSPTASGGTGSYTYQWNYASFLSDNSAANPLGTPPGSLTFSVTVTDEEGCTDTDGAYITVIGGTGVNDSKENIGLSIFPNPVSGALNIKIAGIRNEKQIKISITSLSGQKVHEELCDVKQYFEKELDLSYLAKGFYILKIDGENIHLDRQLIIQ
jgi:hypothetical protein